MAPSLPPDPSAYDREFTFSRIGMAQRRMVWRYLDRMLQMPGMNVLELNCGTGDRCGTLGTERPSGARHGHQ